MSSIDRGAAAAQGAEALRIMQAGEYVAPSGSTVSIRDALARAVAETVEVPPEAAVPAPRPAARTTALEATNEGTITAALRLADAGLDVVALNFASARNPGGGFLSGARAQEESLCRSSGLFACLDGRRMYEHHRGERDALYTSWAIYSPGVPVFRDDDGALLERPRQVAFITAPAPNAKVVLERAPARRGEVHRAVEERIDRVLGIAAAHGHAAVVLGAWGCGVFGNDPSQVATAFDAALRGPFAGVFARVAFAVLDTSRERRFLGPFARRFGGR